MVRMEPEKNGSLHAVLLLTISIMSVSAGFGTVINCENGTRIEWFSACGSLPHNFNHVCKCWVWYHDKL